MKRSFLLLCLLLCAGCQTAPPLPRPEEIKTVAVQSWTETLRKEAATLPGAHVTATAEKLSISYPQESLFSRGSVLPLAGGAEVLDPLAALLSAYPQGEWDANVRAATEHGADYDAALARKRSDLLQRYLSKRGVSADRVTWQTKGEEGIPLELTLRPPHSPETSSSGVKE